VGKENRRVRVYNAEAIGTEQRKQLTKQPYFKMAQTDGIYAVQTHKKGKEDVPTNFVRLDKLRHLSGKARKRARRQINEAAHKVNVQR
jgi:hypothetical protein